ncbi:hypothetical protein [Pseudomonas sp. SWRI111]|uniref:DUF6124 family protein n=1 Tax=Pseudomonas sp. SWRI111 TaxID=2745507 RepID=UPI001EE181FC|nr:hypothetical protein [Pseudomonas sp. SWRI111]
MSAGFPYRPVYQPAHGRHPSFEDLAAPPGSPKYRPVYVVDPSLDDETLLIEACESLSYAHAMAGNIANSIGGPERKPLLALQPVIMLNELLVNRLLDKLKLPQ